MATGTFCYICGYQVPSSKIHIERDKTSSKFYRFIGFRHKDTKDCIQSIIENINPIQKKVKETA